MWAVTCDCHCLQSNYYGTEKIKSKSEMQQISMAICNACKMPDVFVNGQHPMWCYRLHSVGSTCASPETACCRRTLWRLHFLMYHDRILSLRIDTWLLISQIQLPTRHHLRVGQWHNDHRSILNISLSLSIYIDIFFPEGELFQTNCLSINMKSKQKAIHTVNKQEGNNGDYLSWSNK